MSETRATPPLAEFLAAFAQDDNEWWRLQGGDHLNLFEELLDERDAARAEVAALRSAVQTLADAAEDDPEGAAPEALRDLLAASVGSSGEAESGDTWSTLVCVEPGCSKKFSWLGTPQDVRGHSWWQGWTFHDGDHCPEHSPAPVSSGGQADGEGVRLRPDEIERLDFNYQVGDGRWLFTEVEGIIAARLAAHPVLSREAVERRVRGHWPTRFTVPRRLECACGWTRPAEHDGKVADQWLDHLADVLTAGGER